MLTNLQLFLKFKPIFRFNFDLFQRKIPLQKNYLLSKYWQIFKQIAHFQNLNQISKTLQSLKMLTYLLNDDTFFKMLEFLLVLMH